MGKAQAPIISIIGGGALGQTYAAFLAQSGRPVTLLTTPGGAARLREAGVMRLAGGVSLQVAAATAPAAAGQVGVTSDAGDLPVGTGLLFTTKGHQLQEAAAAVRKSWPKPDDDDAWVAGVQNGLAKDDILSRVFGAERVVGAA